jgi:hypothetical protein
LKVSLSIPDRIFRAAERAAKLQKVSRRRFYAQAVEACLKAQSGKPSDKQITEALNAVYATEDSSLDPVIAQLQSLAIAREDW